MNARKGVLGNLLLYLKFKADKLALIVTGNKNISPFFNVLALRTRKSTKEKRVCRGPREKVSYQMLCK